MPPGELVRKQPLDGGFGLNIFSADTGIESNLCAKVSNQLRMPLNRDHERALGI